MKKDLRQDIHGNYITPTTKECFAPIGAKIEIPFVAPAREVVKDLCKA